MRKMTLAGMMVALLVCGGPAFAQEKKPDAKTMREARKKLMDAYNAANEDAAKAEKLALESIELYPEYLQARNFLGWLYNVKIGDFDKAIEAYDYVIRNTDAKDPAEVKAKADALANKGSLVYLQKRDATAALQLYNAAYQVYPIWEYADKASNLYLHIDKTKEALERAKQALVHLTRLEERVQKSMATAAPAEKIELERRLGQLGPQLTKVKVQIATCELLAGNEEGSKKAVEGITSFPRSVKYNLAMLRAAQNNFVGMMNCLKEFMLTRDTPLARNQLREFIREEPVFQRFSTKDEFKEFSKDEVIKDGEK